MQQVGSKNQLFLSLKHHSSFFLCIVLIKEKQMKRSVHLNLNRYLLTKKISSFKIKIFFYFNCLFICSYVVSLQAVGVKCYTPAQVSTRTIKCKYFFLKINNSLPVRPENLHNSETIHQNLMKFTYIVALGVLVLKI